MENNQEKSQEEMVKEAVEEAKKAAAEQTEADEKAAEETGDERDNEVESEVVFDEVLYVDGKVGTPTVKGAKVVAKVLKHGKQKKILVFKYKPKKKYRKTQGHRQPYTKILIKSITK